MDMVAMGIGAAAPLHIIEKSTDAPIFVAIKGGPTSTQTIGDLVHASFAAEDIHRFINKVTGMDTAAGATNFAAAHAPAHLKVKFAISVGRLNAGFDRGVNGFAFDSFQPSHNDRRRHHHQSQHQFFHCLTPYRTYGLVLNKWLASLLVAFVDRILNFRVGGRPGRKCSKSNAGIEISS